MKEHSILFSTPMVRALLEGHKTQTRRMVKPAPPTVEAVRKRSGSDFSIFDDTNGRLPFRVGGPVWAVRDLMGMEPETSPEWRSRYGVAGDRLWVRETWCGHWGNAQPGARTITESGEILQTGHKHARASVEYPLHLYYRADRNETPLPHLKWTTPIHMPRWASRITLEVTGLRVERLHDISEADAKEEGIFQLWPGAWHWQKSNIGAGVTPRTAFAALWESVNGVDSWRTNPWVWVVEFRPT